MTPSEFRKLALSHPDIIEGSHMGHADFRVGGKIFATLGHPDDRYAMIKLSPIDQDLLVRSHPEAFAPAAGAWGRSGSTVVTLDAAAKRLVSEALESALYARAPKKRRSR